MRALRVASGIEMMCMLIQVNEAPMEFDQRDVVTNYTRVQFGTMDYSILLPTMPPPLWPQPHGHFKSTLQPVFPSPRRLDPTQIKEPIDATLKATPPQAFYPTSAEDHDSNILLRRAEI